MTLDEKVISDFESSISAFVPGYSVDCVIFRYRDHDLQVLLLKWKSVDIWALPGGFVFKNEDIDEAALRVVRERVGIESIFLNQFYTFGRYNRRDLDQVKLLFDIMGMNSPLMMHWFAQRFITTAYLALVNTSKQYVPETEFISSACEWTPLSNLPKLAFDHLEIIEKARERLRVQVNYLPVGINLLNETFTIKELQQLYETIMDIKLDRSNFQRRILKLGILVRLEKKFDGGSHKAPYLYSFDKEKYRELNERGISFFK